MASAAVEGPTESSVWQSLWTKGLRPYIMSSPTSSSSTAAAATANPRSATADEPGTVPPPHAAPSRQPERPYKCALSPELRRQAEEELGETHLMRRLAFESLRQLMRSRPDIAFTRDERFLLRFLRAKKFETDRAFRALVKYYELHQRHPAFFGDYRKSSVRRILEDGFPLVLSTPDPEGRPIVAVRTRNWDTNNYGVLDIAKALFMVMEDLLESEEVQIVGLNLLIDLEGMSTHHIMQMGPSAAKKITSIYQNCVPVRLNSIHFVNEPLVFDAGFAILKTFMAEKMRKRVQVHGTDFTALHRSLPPSILPSNWGGELGPYSNEAWREAFLRDDRDFAPAASEGVLSSRKKSRKSKKKHQRQEGDSHRR